MEYVCGPGDVTHSRTCCFLGMTRPKKSVPVLGVKQFHDTCFNHWSDHCSSTNRCKSFGTFIGSRMSVLSVCWNDTSKNILHVWNSFVAHTVSHPSREPCIFANLLELISPGQCLNVTKTFSQSVARCWLCPRGRYQRVHFLRIHHIPNLFVRIGC